jgi:hypothetical protein
MKKLLVVPAVLAIGVVGLGAMGIPAAAQASPIIECGSRAIDGAHNITTRNVSCSDAYDFVDKFSYLPDWYTGSVTLPGWHTYWVHFQYQPWIGLQDDVRATRTNHVIHFQIGPYGVSPGPGLGKCWTIPAGQACY